MIVFGCFTAYSLYVVVIRLHVYILWIGFQGGLSFRNNEN